MSLQQSIVLLLVFFSQIHDCHWKRKISDLIQFLLLLVAGITGEKIDWSILIWFIIWQSDSLLWFSYVISPFMVLCKKFPLFLIFIKCKGRIGLFRKNVTVNTDFALIHFYCPLYKQFHSRVFLLIFHALNDFLKWRGKIYWWKNHWTPKRRCKFWRHTNKCSIGTLHYNFYPNPPAFFMAELFQRL